MKYNIMLTGPVGTGKTYSVHTFLDAGKELFILSTEPGIDTIVGEWKAKGVDLSRVHVAKVMPATIDWETLIANAERTSMLDMKALQSADFLYWISKNEKRKKKFKNLIAYLQLSDLINGEPTVSIQHFIKTYGV